MRDAEPKPVVDEGNADVETRADEQENELLDPIRTADRKLGRIDEGDTEQTEPNQSEGRHRIPTRSRRGL